MGQIASISVDSASSPARWFAVRTASRHEKKVAKHIAEQSVETYLPLYQARRHWKKSAPAVLDLPLFPTYVFARIPASVRGAVLASPGVLSIVGNGKEALPVPDADIARLRSALCFSHPEPHPAIAIGERVRVIAGPLSGFEGVLLRQQSPIRLVLTIQLTMQSISIEVDIDQVESMDVNAVAFAAS